MSDFEQAGQRDKKFYANEKKYVNYEVIEWFPRRIGELSQYVGAIAPRLKAHDEAHGGLKILELGAGTCLTSLLIRKFLERGHFVL